MFERQNCDDRAYYARRAEQERAIAAMCEDGAVACAHRRMAEEYERRALSNERVLQLVGSD